MTIDAGPDELFTTLATPRDAPAIVALVNAAYRGLASRRGWTSEAGLVEGPRTDEESVAALVAAPGNAILVLRGPSALNGCVHVEKAADELAYIGMLSIRPAMQGSLFGRSLLAAAERFASREYGARTIELTVVDVREELIAWYERRGYRLTGELRPFPTGESKLGTPTRDDLNFVVFRRALES